MAYSYTWPATLPQSPLRDGFAIKKGMNILRTPQDKGPAKLRRRGAMPSVMSCVFSMTAAQVETFESFFHDTIRGVARFGFTDPTTGQVAECRIVHSDDGAYDISPTGPGRWNVSMQLEVMP